MNEASNQPDEHKVNFDTIEKWFNDALRILKLLIFSLETIKEDDRNPVECISLREKLDEFATGYTFFGRAKRYQEIYDTPEFSQVLEDIKTANGLQISSGIHHLKIDGKIHLTAAEALGTVLKRICFERQFLAETVKDYDEIRDDYVTKYPQANWEEYWYGIINFHVIELSECGVNKESLEQIRILFDQQKYCYLNWTGVRSGDNSTIRISGMPQPEQVSNRDTYGIEELREWFGYPDYRILRKYIEESGLFEHVSGERFNSKEVYDLVKYMQSRRLTGDYKRNAEKIIERFTPKE
jgi:hypothetical protein